MPNDARSPGKIFVERMREIGSLVEFERNDALSHEGDRSDHVFLLTTGFVVATKRTVRGKQQNVAFHFPGDIIDHESFTMGYTRCGSVATTPTICHKVSHRRLRSLIESDAAHQAAFWRYIAFQGALGHEWLLNLGRRSAYERTAHLLCEIAYRSGRDFEELESCQISLTQTEIANTLGLSIVHVNRTLMRLRQQKLITLKGGQLHVIDWSLLKAAAGFDSGYLSPEGS